MAVYIRAGKRWGVGLPWWVAVWLAPLWLTWVLLLMTWNVLVLVWMTLVWTWKALVWTYGYLTRRKTDQLQPSEHQQDR